MFSVLFCLQSAINNESCSESEVLTALQCLNVSTQLELSLLTAGPPGNGSNFSYSHSQIPVYQPVFLGPQIIITNVRPFSAEHPQVREIENLV